MGTPLKKTFDHSALDLMRDLAVEYRPISSLAPNARNARTHSKRQIGQIAKSIAEFGFTSPILIDEKDRILAGHGRTEAARQLGMDKVPTIRIGDLTEEQKRAYLIADNQLALKAGWDKQTLAIEFQELSALDLDFDLGVTGFEVAEIDLIIGGLTPANDNDPVETVPAPTADAVTRHGDLWLLDSHRILCGDATKADDFSRLMQGRKAQMVFADPPYNVKIGGHVSGLGAVQHREFAMASGEMSRPEFTGFLKTVFGNLAEHSEDGSIHFQCIDFRHMREMLEAGEAVYSELKNLCVWNKTNGGMGSLYRSKHELIFVWKHGAAPHINNVELGKHGRNRTNVWDYAGVNTFGSDRKDLALHPTVKPVALVADAILDCSKRKGLVLDCFLGSGSTLLAAEKTGRICHGLELDLLYVDVAIRRWQERTGKQAVHAETNKTFTELLDDRRTDDPPQEHTSSSLNNSNLTEADHG